MTKTFPFNCPVVVARVVVTVETLSYSGIGSSVVVTQRDYECSREGSCEHRTTAVCRVRQMNG